MHSGSILWSDLTPGLFDIEKQALSRSTVVQTYLLFELSNFYVGEIRHACFGVLC